MWFFDSVRCAWTVVLCVRGRGKVSSVAVVVVIVLGWMVYRYPVYACRFMYVRVR